MKTSEKTQNISVNNQPRPAHRILIVDDEPKICALLVRILEKLPYETEAVSDGNAALEALSHSSCDLIIVDLRMPGMDGETLMREVRKTDEGIAFIVLTGHGSLQEAYSLLRDFRISDFIQKPLHTPEQLLFSVENALEKQRLEQKLQEHTEALANMNTDLRREIENRRRAEQATIESELKYRTIFKKAAEGILIADIETRKFKHANPAICEMLGYTEKELLKMDVLAIHPKEAMEQVIADFERLSRSKKAHEPNIPCLKKNGTIFYVEIKGGQALIEGRKCNIGFFRDITERKQAEEVLLESEKKYRQIFEQANDTIFISDLETQKYIEVNQRAVEVLGYTIKEFLKMSPQDIAGKNQQVPATEIIEQIKKQGSAIFEYRANKKDGTEIIFQAHTQLVQRNDKTLVQTFARDITETKKMEEQLQLADRLDTLGRLAGGIAHEIRNPLAGINLYVDILKEKSEVEFSAPEREILDEIRENINRMAEIIRRVIDFADPSAGASMEIDINTLIREELHIWSERFKILDINPELSLEDDIPSISGKAIELRQVLGNLIQNAVDAMEKAGALRISTDFGVSSFHKARPVVIIKVKDTGSGIKPEEKRLVYNPFFTTRHSSSGLGLAIVHQIVERHGGVITCESEPGKGTTFTIELPCMSAKQTVV